MCQCQCQCQCQCKPVSFIDQPGQLTFNLPDTRFPDSYHDGFATGVEWDGNWMPGGPWVYEGSKNAALRESSKAAHTAWMKGFDDGLELRLKNNAHFARWWDKNNGRKVAGQYLRYVDPTCGDVV